MKSRHKSRKQTPWDDCKELSATQEFIRMHYIARYQERHPTLEEANEAAMINSYEPRRCPFCGSEKFAKIGHDANGIRRYKCSCGKKFKPTTGTIFDSRKSVWMRALGIIGMQFLHQNTGLKSFFLRLTGIKIPSFFLVQSGLMKHIMR